MLPARRDRPVMPDPTPSPRRRAAATRRVRRPELRRERGSLARRGRPLRWVLRVSPRQSVGITADVPAGTVVFATGKGSNVIDVDGNRYVDLAAGFGALLLGHGHPNVLRVLELASARLLQALGDVHPSDAKIALSERLVALYPEPGARVILGQSGADAVTAALKTAVLATEKPGVVAFRGAYHGLSYAPLSVSALRDGYRAPFSEQLNPHVTFLDFPSDEPSGERTLDEARAALSNGSVGAVVIEPVLGRGGCIVPPSGFLAMLATLARESGALFIADEIWTGLGRSGSMLRSTAEGVLPDVVCLGKGLGGGLPISACIGSGSVMSAWRREPEVVHTSTFAGAPLAAATAIATLDVLSRERLARSERGSRRQVDGESPLLRARGDPGRHPTSAARA